jgi:hypothetical protein
MFIHRLTVINRIGLIMGNYNDLSDIHGMKIARRPPSPFFRIGIFTKRSFS